MSQARKFLEGKIDVDEFMVDSERILEGEDPREAIEEAFQPSGAMADHLWEQVRPGIENLLKNRDEVEFLGKTRETIRSGAEYKIKLHGQLGLITIKPSPGPDNIQGWIIRLESGTTGQSRPVAEKTVETKDDVSRIREQINVMLNRNDL